jgi:hypothetical protein
MDVVEPLPFPQFRLEIDVTFVAEQLVEFLAIRLMRSFDFTVQLRRSALDVGVAEAKVLNVPMKFGLELMPVVRSNFLDAERELFDDEVDKINRVGLSMLLVDFQGTNTRGIVNGRLLKASYILALFSYECQKLGVHLDVVSPLSRFASKPLPGNGDLLVIAFGMSLAHAGPARQPVEVVAAKDARHRCVRYPYVVVSLKIPNDPHWP